MSDFRIIRKQRNIAAAQTAAGNTDNRSLKGTSSGRARRAKRREEDLGGKARRPLEHVGPHEDGLAGAIHDDPRCATLYENNNRSDERYTHRTPRPGGGALWAHRSPRHRHPERDAEQHDQHHKKDDDGDLQHVDDRTTRPLRAPFRRSRPEPASLITSPPLETGLATLARRLEDVFGVFASSPMTATGTQHGPQGVAAAGRGPRDDAAGWSDPRWGLCAT